MSVREAIAVMMVLLAWAPLARAGKRATQDRTDHPVASLQGRIDHLSLDVAGQRLFVSALGNDTPKSRGSADGSANARRLS